MTRAYNRWGQEMFETSGGRVIVAGPVPLNDVTRAGEEIRYAHGPVLDRKLVGLTVAIVRYGQRVSSHYPYLVMDLDRPEEARQL